MFPRRGGRAKRAVKKKPMEERKMEKNLREGEKGLEEWTLRKGERRL